MKFRSCMPVTLAGTNTAQKDFEDLLSAAWAAQLAQLRARPHSDDSLADPDPQITTGKEKDLDVDVLRDKKAFAPPTVEASCQVYSMRSEHQIRVSPRAHEDAR